MDSLEKPSVKLERLPVLVLNKNEWVVKPPTISIAERIEKLRCGGSPWESHYWEDEEARQG